MTCASGAVAVAISLTFSKHAAVVGGGRAVARPERTAAGRAFTAPPFFVVFPNVRLAKHSQRAYRALTARASGAAAALGMLHFCHSQTALICTTLRSYAMTANLWRHHSVDAS